VQFQGGRMGEGWSTPSEAAEKSSRGVPRELNITPRSAKTALRVGPGSSARGVKKKRLRGTSEGVS